MKTMKKIVAILAVALMLCSILPLSVFAAPVTGTFEKYTGTITEGDYIIVYQNYAMTAAVSSSRFTNTTVTVTNNTITNPDASIVWHIAPNGEYWNIYNDSTQKYAASTGAKNKGQLLASGTDNKSLWTVTGDGTYEFVNKANKAANVNSNLRNNGTYGFACYATSTGGALTLYKLKTDEPESDCQHENAEYEYNCQLGYCPDCEEELPAKADHSYEESVTLAPTCTTAGEKTLTCACGDVKTETVNALGHTYVDGFCSECGEAQPLEVTIETFANTGVLDGTASISWTNGGFSVVNKKGSSTNAIRTDDTDHFRVYVGNTFTVSGGAMAKVVINCVSGYPINDSTNKVSDGWTVTANGTAITYTATNGSADELTITIGKQSRVKSVVITPYVEAPSDCEHDYVGVETQAPTCKAEGVMTYTCSKCQESYTEAIAVIPHSYVEVIIDATCTTTGTITYECSVCFHSYDETIPMKAHNYVDDVCADCGHVKAYKGTIDFSNAEQRTELTTQIQIWANEGLTFTNNKLSGNNIADYTDPIRIYKNSGIVIEFPEMSKLIIDASGVGNDYLWDATLEAAGLSFTVENKIYTITFAEAVNSIELTAANQVRANSITAVVAHECTYDSVVTDPTCVNGGYTTNTCTKCGDSNVSDATEALGHTYAHDFDVDCDVCGTVRAVAGPITFGGKSISEDVSGLAFRFNVAVDGMEVNGTTAIYDSATINGYKLISMGAIVSNEKSKLDIPAVYLCDLEDHSAAFAVRVINIPAAYYDSVITATPYFVVEIDGVATTIYGEAQTGSYAAEAG